MKKEKLENMKHNTENAENKANELTTEEVLENTDPTPVDYKEKYEELNDSYIRLMAEFDNYRKRTLKEKTDLIKNGGEKVVVNILPIVDNLERAIENNEKTDDLSVIREGVKLIYVQLMGVLKQEGVCLIDTAKSDFDTEYHEAITTIAAPSEEQKGKILDCTQKGYTLNDKVIRHSKVVVGE